LKFRFTKKGAGAFSVPTPGGFWKPVHAKVVKADPDFKSDANFKRDMFNIVIGIHWQTSLVVIPIYIVIREKASMFEAIASCSSVPHTEEDVVETRLRIEGSFIKGSPALQIQNGLINDAIR